jgi:spermidine/putrescine transport system substrate-binding protein
MNKSITLLTWPDYISPDTLGQFESEFGIGVNLDIVPSAVELVERLQADGPPPDLLCPPDYAVRELGAQNLLKVLDHTLLPNLKNLEPRFQKGRPHDPNSRVSVTKDWGTTGFMYRSDLIDESPRSWADFWRLACSPKISGRVTVLDSPGEVIGAALKMHKYSYNDSTADKLAVVRSDLLKLKPHLLAFETNYKPLLASGDVWLALGWNGDAAVLTSQAVSVKYIVPIEGSQIWEDDWAISAKARNPEMAHTFLNFLLTPEVAAQEARYTRYATANREALPLLDDEMRNDISTYPPQNVLQKLEPGMPLDSDGQKRREELWKEIRV